MRLASAVQVTRKDQVETSVAVAVDVEFFQERHHDRTIGRLIERGMETPVPPSPGLHSPETVRKDEGFLLRAGDLLHSC